MAAQKHIALKVEGMDCNNCAIGISNYLKKKGLQDVNVNFQMGEVEFTLVENVKKEHVEQGIKDLGYEVVGELGKVKEREKSFSIFSLEFKFYLSLFFTVPLLLHMFVSIDFLHDPYFQLICSLPVVLMGTWYFGKSAINSLKTGVPNMDVLIVTGVVSAFAYSVAGFFLAGNVHELHNYLFFETAASIVCFVLLGNLIEKRSVSQTTTAIKAFSKLQEVKAKRVKTLMGEEKIDLVPAAELHVGDVFLINTGDAIATDGIVMQGTLTVDESMITGESRPVEKNSGDKLVGSTIVLSGNAKVKVEHTLKDNTLSKIINLVKNAQQNKPAIQRLGDKVSAIFVPAVMAISLITFIVAHFVFDIAISKALMQAVAVLVISCPCAMGLATPTAVMVGVGRAAKNGILIKGGSTVEVLSDLKTIAFDKTGTLTTGDFVVEEIKLLSSEDEKSVYARLLGLEQLSSHPLAKSLVNHLKPLTSSFAFEKVEEIKGRGIKGFDKDGNEFWLSGKDQDVSLLQYDLVLYKNKIAIAAVRIEDKVKEGTKEVIEWLKKRGIKTVMISGDRKDKCEKIGAALGIEEIYSEQLPELKLQVIAALKKYGKLAMVGDGINDAASLTAADVGISFAKATDVAQHSAQVVLLKHEDLFCLKDALIISNGTLKTIRQNLFWAFFYNVIAIPIAAIGFLTPMVGALSMAFSDIVVIGNSIFLKTKKLRA